MQTQASAKTFVHHILLIKSRNGTEAALKRMDIPTLRAATAGASGLFPDCMALIPTDGVSSTCFRAALEAVVLPPVAFSWNIEIQYKH